MDTITPGRAGTISRAVLHTSSMGDGTDKNTRVILDGQVKLYVGIGWIDERPAVQADADSFPVVVDTESVVITLHSNNAKALFESADLIRRIGFDHARPLYYFTRALVVWSVGAHISTDAAIDYRHHETLTVETDRKTW